MKRSDFVEEEFNNNVTVYKEKERVSRNEEQ